MPEHTTLPPALEVHNLTVSHDTTPVLWSIDFAVPRGRCAALVGPNGAGKTTLLKTLLGIHKQSAGEVYFSGQRTTKMSGQVAYVPQRTEVDWNFPVTVEDVVLMGRAAHLSFYGRPNKHDKKIAAHALEQVGLTDFKNRPIGKLSGGQQQRAFMARALAQEAAVLLLDEPFAGVDANTEHTLVGVLKNLQKEGRTIFCVHHDLHTLKEYFDWVVMINLSLVASGPTEEVCTPENLARTYGARSNILSQVGEQWQNIRFRPEQHE